MNRNITILFPNFQVVVENPKGSLREGPNWVQRINHDYGYIVGTKVGDGDELDCFVGCSSNSGSFYVIEQAKEDGTFDEYKIMLKFSSATEALEAYKSNYRPNWNRILSIKEIPMEHFWAWYEGLIRSKRIKFVAKNQFFGGKETFLRPIIAKSAYEKMIAKAILYELYLKLYKPMIEILSPEKENAKESPLIEAFRSGRIYFIDGFVYGKFSAALSKELLKLGAKFYKLKKAYKVSLSVFSPEIRSSIANKLIKDKERIKEVNKELDKLKENSPYIDFSPYVSPTFQDLNIQFKKVTPESLQIPFEMNDHIRKSIEEEYIYNLNFYVSEWHQEAVERLRTKVLKNVTEGYRANRLIDAIMEEQEVSYRKAKFIARQETSLLVSKYREERYKEAGVNQYRWSTSQDERVRDDHKALNNRIFSWDDPPIVDKVTGKRAHPGEDFNCRCVALPVIKGVAI